MCKRFPILILLALCLLPCPGEAQPAHRDSVIADSLLLLRPIHFSKDTGEGTRMARRAYIRLLREQARSASAREKAAIVDPLSSFDSIWQHNVKEREALVDKLLSMIEDTATDYALRLRFIRLLGNTGHPKALRFLVRNISLIEYTNQSGDASENWLCLELAYKQPDPWYLFKPLMESICEDPHDEDLEFLLLADMLYRMTDYDTTYSLSLVQIYLSKTRDPQGQPNPRLQRFYEYLQRE